MNKIIFPLKLRMKGEAVADLQEALQLLRERGALQPTDAERPALEKDLARERREGAYGPATRRLVALLQEQSHLKPTGEVDEPTAGTLNRLLVEQGALGVQPTAERPGYEVKGTVRLADGSPAAGITVAAFDLDLRFEQPLGQGPTDNKGFFIVRYHLRQIRRREKGRADLIVKALAADGSELVASPVLFDAPPSAKVDLTIPAESWQPPVLFEKIARALQPSLEGLKIEDLEEDERHRDLTFLAGETGFAKRDLARFVLAHRLARRQGEPEFWFALLGGSFFAYDETHSLAEQFAELPASLASLNTAAVRKSLAGSFNRKEIPELPQEKVAGWTEAFLNFAAESSVSDVAGPTFTRLALQHAGITDAAKQAKFARLFNEHRALTPELLGALEKDRTFAAAEIADLRTSFQLGELTKADFPVVKMIEEEFRIWQPEQIRALAKKSEDDWVNLVKNKCAAGEIELPIALGEVAGQVKLPEAEIYAKTLATRFREAFPTTAFAGGLARAVQNGGARGLRHAEAWRGLLERHEDFELLNTPVEEFFKKDDLAPDLARLGKNKEFKSEVKAAQRIFKLVPTFEATDGLLADGLRSARRIYQMGESQFVRRYGDRPGFTVESARLAWNRAADTHAAVLTIVGELHALHGASLPRALSRGSAALESDTEARKSFPNWDNLFRTGDLGECLPCRSVLSPAAYFADLLMFLADRTLESGKTAKDILFARRPDLGFLELNCDNAMTPLPYIDVVCEVLEAAIAKDDIELAGFTSMPTDANQAKTAVAAAFAATTQKISLGADFSLTRIDPNDSSRWVAHGDDATYLLKKEAADGNFFAELLRNTKVSAAELRAYPQYVNPKAYAKLREAKHPLLLPFDLYAEEVRAGFKKCNLQRWDLMRTLRGKVNPNNPTEGEIAAEYFGISAGLGAPPNANFDEKGLILDPAATDADKQVIWGEKDNAAWINTVSNVKTFLNKTGLEYNELLALLDLKFINPGANPNADLMWIKHEDASSDTEQKTLQNLDALDAAPLDRIHRFLRLWRKLDGWKMWELDLAINQLGGGKLDEPFLVSLYYFGEVRKKLGGKASVEQVCALFHDLNIASHFTKLHAKRGDALYQSLFLNKKLISPLDEAFEIVEIAPGVSDLTSGAKIAAHHSVIQAALGLQEADLLVFKNLKKADGNSYIEAAPNDKLNLANLSFLCRHAWLAKTLKYKASEWEILLKLFNQDLQYFASPKSAWEFLEQIEHLKATGFTPDELNWLLAADRSAKAATKEDDAVKFLLSLRKELQAVKAEYDVTPPEEEEQLTALLTSLMQKLNRTEAETQSFLKTLRGSVLLETQVQSLTPGFTFPATITGAPNYLRIQYDDHTLRFVGIMTAAQRTILLTHASLSSVTGNSDYQNAIESLFQQSQAAGSNYVSTTTSLAPTGLTLPVERPSLPISFDANTKMVSFLGVMTDAEQAELKAIASNPTDAIDELYQFPRLAVKFYEPKFTTALEALPAAVDFKTLRPAALIAKISYDAEQHLLCFTGIMSREEQAELLKDLENEVAYQEAVNSLYAEPRTIGPTDPRVWLTSTDLDASKPGNETLTQRLTNAINKALTHLSQTFTENAVVQQSSEKLGLTPAMTRKIMADFTLVAPNTILNFFTDSFRKTTGVLDYAGCKEAFDTWYWLNRLAAILKKWKVNLEEFEILLTLQTPAQLLNFQMLPLNDSKLVAELAPFLRTHRLLRLRDSLPEDKITFLEVLKNLNESKYLTAPAFAADVQRLNEAWRAADVAALTGLLDLTYPDNYFLAENWERLRRAFYFLDNLNAGAAAAQSFAAAAMTKDHAKTLKELLRSKFGSETWLTLSAEIQDALRERKRDALTAYLLSQPKPADAPSDKWEDANDLYAYHLLDVEMCARQLTSRLVQGAGSVQLFVQRCFLGLEKDVAIKADGADGDSAWRWWKWMRKYRVWEANRKVFLWPENWIEPELRKDKSAFFSDLENELLQNDIDQYTAEAAFQKYLEKLDGVAQLEIAGFYQEDDGDNAILHLFGRTAGAEPHLYYYRRYDYRQWTPWEKVEVDIQGDYLIPAVVGKRLFLFWPVFTEVPDEKANSTVAVPTIVTAASSGSSVSTSANTMPMQPAIKWLKLQLAVSEYQRGKWTPKRVSKDFYPSYSYSGEIVKKHYSFWPVDRSDLDGRFGIRFGGFSVGEDGTARASLYGSFEISGCKGVPEKADFLGQFAPAIRPESASIRIEALTGDYPTFMKWEESAAHQDSPENDLTLENHLPVHSSGDRFIKVLEQTPGIFKISPPWFLSYLEKLWLDQIIHVTGGNRIEYFVRVGTWLPFFYSDKKRTFFVLPSIWQGTRETAQGLPRGREYYPEMKREIRHLEVSFEAWLQRTMNELDLSGLSDDQLEACRQSLYQRMSDFLPETSPNPQKDRKKQERQVKELLTRYIRSIFRGYLAHESILQCQRRQFHFKNFYHPFVCDFAKLVYNPLKGIPTLMSRETQLKNTSFDFSQIYGPTEWVVQKGTEDFYPKEVVDFSPDGAYSPYNWELFFHIPLMIANQLSKNQRFEEARDWYHFIFNPIGLESANGGSVMSKYWITKPFFETTDEQYVQQRIDNILRMLADDARVPGYSALESQVVDWRNNPFEPHRIANYRTVAYQKTVVIKYLDNLIAWGDFLFRQDSMESINEATQLYILAAEILGPRPKLIPPQGKPPVQTFNELEGELDKFANAWVEAENLVPVMAGASQEDGDAPPLPMMLYFCLPQNEKLLGYWDTVADRLYKIRHCMNIEGVERQLALFEPPIDPGALVKAVAGGVDIGAALADLNAPLPLYRFNTLLQKANEVCNDVKALGGALLAALEKKDAEALGLLRQSHENRLLEAVKAVREKQLEEAKENLAGIEASKLVVETRRNYYRDIERLTGKEKLHLDKLDESHTRQEIAQGIKTGAAILSILPAIDLGASGFGGSPIAKFKLGGLELGQAAELAADVLSCLSQMAANDAAMASALASFERRWDDWKLQESLAQKELDQFERQIAAAELRIAIAEKELENHTLQIENAKAIDEFMRSKYTNLELYQWQVGQISGVYFQSYKLAYDLAKRAERCFRFELGVQDSSYINFGYWDSLKKGLLAGEKLQYDLRRLEAAYLEQNRREFELTKHISLALLDPLALVMLRETGRCFLRLPEELFDLDYPGHFFRRIKSVSLTLPCIVGPYTTVSCTLRLLKNSIRANTANGNNGYTRDTDDSRFIESNIPVKAIAASNAQNDSGIFELSFRDERYLPFEGAGAVSEWSLELFSDPGSTDFGKSLRQFDYGSISDAILHVKYTAREDAGVFKKGAISHLRDYFEKEGTTPALRMFNLRHEFPSQWHRFLHPTEPANGNIFELEMSPGLFPFRDQGNTLKINTLWLLARCTKSDNYEVVLTLPWATQPPAGTDKMTLAPVSQYGGLHFSQKDIAGFNIKIVPTPAPAAKWQLQMSTSNGSNLGAGTTKDTKEVEDLFLVIGYEWE